MVRCGYCQSDNIVSTDVLATAKEHHQNTLTDFATAVQQQASAVTSAGRLGAIDWIFNGWGGQDWASWDRDADIAAVVTRAAGAIPVSSLLVNEGGGIQVDGAGTVIVTETVQLDPGRNPHATRFMDRGLP